LERVPLTDVRGPVTVAVAGLGLIVAVVGVSIAITLSSPLKKA